MSDCGGFCQCIFSFKAVGSLGVYKLVLGLLQIITSVVVLAYIEYHNEKKRLSGMMKKSTPHEFHPSHEPLVLPLYFILLWGLVVADLYQGVLSFVCPISATHASWPCTAGVSVGYGVYHVVLEGAALLCMQYGAGIKTLVRVFKISIVWGVVTGAVWGYSFRSTSTPAFVCKTVWEVCLVVFYMVLWLSPAHRVFRRPSVLAYAGFFAIMWVLNLVTDSLHRADLDFSTCVSMVTGVLFWGIGRPFVFYRLLWLDSLFWQGSFPATTGPQMYWDSLKKRFLAFRLNSETSSVPMLGFEASKHAPNLHPASARGLAYAVDTTGAYGSMLVSAGVRLVNFATLSLGSGTVLGAGGTAKVYLGKLDGEEIAVKMLYPMDLTLQTVERFMKECRILSTLKNENIIAIRGVCIVPPSICICLELASRGSLFGFLRSGVQLDWQKRFRMSLDCVRAVAFLHSREPPVVHNDIKSLNFFVMKDERVKLGDFDFGWQNEDDVPRVPHTLNWLAPEVVLQSQFSTASDVYGVAMVVWEICSGDVPFDTPEHSDTNVLRRAITLGQRPPLPADWPPTLKSLLTQAWDKDPARRPEASEMETILEMLLSLAGSVHGAK